jgi:hypothetical protein
MVITDMNIIVLNFKGMTADGQWVGISPHVFKREE